MAIERTLILIKPDGVQRGLMGTIIDRFERKGLKVIGLKLMDVTVDVAQEHYREHASKPFFGGLVAFITASPVIAMVWEGPDAIAAARTLMGSTNPVQATPGTIRGDFGIDVGHNLVHGSDSPGRAEVEISLFFTPQEIVAWKRDAEGWIRELPKTAAAR